MKRRMQKNNELSLHSPLNLNDPNSFNKMFTKTKDPMKQLLIIEKMQDIQYKHHERTNEIRNREITNNNLSFISEWWTVIGIPLGYFLSHVIILIGWKSVPSVTVGAVAAGAIVAKNWIGYNLFGLKSDSNSSTASKVTSNVADFMDSLIPIEIRVAIIGASILVCTCFVYYMIHKMNTARAVARK